MTDLDPDMTYYVDCDALPPSEVDKWQVYLLNQGYRWGEVKYFCFDIKRFMIAYPKKTKKVMFEDDKLLIKAQYNEPHHSDCPFDLTDEPELIEDISRQDVMMAILKSKPDDKDFLEGLQYDPDDVTIKFNPDCEYPYVDSKDCTHDYQEDDYMDINILRCAPKMRSCVTCGEPEYV